MTRGLVLAAVFYGIGAEARCLAQPSPGMCRSSVDEGGEKCVWCVSKAIPSECLPASVAEVGVVCVAHAHYCR